MSSAIHKDDCNGMEDAISDMVAKIIDEFASVSLGVAMHEVHNIHQDDPEFDVECIFGAMMEGEELRLAVKWLGFDEEEAT